MGLGDFVHGISEGVGGLASDIVGAPVSIGKDIVGAAVNAQKAGLYVANPTHWDDIGKGVAKVADYAWDHPGQTWDTGFEVGRAMVKEELKPQNLIINAALLATGVGAPALLAKAGLGAKTAETAVTAVRGIEAAEDAVAATRTASRTQRAVQAVARGAEKVDSVLGAPQRLQSQAMEAIPGLRKINQFGAWRGAQAEGLMARAAESSFPMAETLARPVARRVAGGDLAASAVHGGNAWTDMVWRGQKVKSLSETRENLNNVAIGVQAVAHPEQAAARGAQMAWNEWGDEAIGYAARHGGQGVVKNLLGGGDDKKKRQEQSSSQYETAAPPDFTPTEWNRTSSSTGFAQPSRRTPTSDVSTSITTDSTMPTQVGPSDWYGPQGGYSAGRGFTQPDQQQEAWA
jgi:hypothetical protein